MFYSLGGWRSVGSLLVILALGASLWWVKGRIDRSYDADRLKVELLNAKLDIISLQNRVRIVDRERLALVVRLSDARYFLEQQSEKAKARVKVMVRDNPACRLGPDAISLLNTARTQDHGLPSTAAGSPAVPEAAATNPEN